MPELPEVEVVRSGLERHLRGSLIRSVEVLDPRSVRRDAQGPERFAAALTGTVLADVARRGKYVWLLLAEPGASPAAGERGVAPAPGAVGERGVVVHLGMSGQALIKDPDAARERHLRIRMGLLTPDGASRELRFVDQRIFGGMFLDPLIPEPDGAPAASASALGLPLLPASVAHIGRDPLDPHFDAAAFRRRLKRTSSGIKRVLLDQTVLSGIGNIYADESLWRARLHYAKPADTLTGPQADAILRASSEVMAEALQAGGTSFDALYIDVNGQSGYFERGLNVYGRAGEPCRRCEAEGRDGIIVREPFMNRSSYRCPRCQRAPRGFRAGRAAG
ncbi:bifunctional DNA-formamidopyrimidine glycosylase/DNA-(apurinic or apyrimidinic site) lyase [Rothia halotolerans]|uniref:bifunctional DNA-formamidopyrimidine glycosylase/DNA-(apurinic or apyrimidinic site) lyase n=1 Tax=Rothia halotolerans TaxID=405770 RepID=UPI00101C2474|nr:bifunctional DNA-formamidopyrimidine glycosylase/DNA-(apurinic or apyrimidinic site) lyase [Rothia halotolerans]